MKIEHIALWTKDLEQLKSFYEKYFNAKPGEKYTNEKKQFSSYFLRLEDGARLELMSVPQNSKSSKKNYDAGFHHLAFSVGSKEEVDRITKQLSDDGFEIIGWPRTTGDGYYESSFYDCDGNFIEITI